MNVRKSVVLVLALCLPLSAHAYVDPGSGMLLWQGLIAAIGGVLAFVHDPVGAIKRLLERFKRK